jgi:hypothetical protein
VQVVDVEMHKLEVVSFTKDALQHVDVVRQLIHTLGIHPQGLRTSWNQARAGH